MSHRLAACLLLSGLAACAGDRPVRLSGAETATETARTHIVPAAITRTAEGMRMELVAADGTPLTGLLQEVREPVVVPLAGSRTPLVGGGILLVGPIAGGGTTLDCRFRLLNPVRGVDGGGNGHCAGPARQVEFIF
jgi:hypothetical protein